MTREEIIVAIINNGWVDGVYEDLRRIREERYKNLIDETSKARATLKLIRKVSKDKVVQDILSD